MDERRKALLCVIGASLLYSTGGLLMKWVPWNGMAINGARMTLSILLLLVFLKTIGHKIRMNKWIFLGSLCFLGATALFSVANKLTTAANAIVLQFTAPIFLVIYVLVFQRKKPRKLDLAACALVFGGVICFFMDSLSGGGAAGNLIAILSGAAYGGVFMLRSMPEGDAYSSVFWGSLWGVLTGLPFVAQETDFSPRVLLCVALLGFFQVGLGYILLCLGLRYTPPVTACLVTGVEPVLNPLLVAIFYHEKMTALSLVGAVIVIVGVVGYNLVDERLKSAPSGEKS